MRIISGITFAVLTVGVVATARAQAPAYPYPYDTGTSFAPAGPPVVYQPSQPSPYDAAPPAYQPPPAYQAPSYPTAPGYYPPPYYAQPPAYYPPPAYSPPPAYYPPPVYLPRPYYPAPRFRPYRRGYCSGSGCTQGPALAPGDRARYFSIGGRFTAISLNQQIGDSNTMLMGGGLELRFRGRGHFGIEASLDFLHGDFQLNGPVLRDSIPFQLSALLYLFKNSDLRHFNMYFMGGVGVMGTTMTLNDEHNAQVKQDFTEYEGHLGIGMELRWKWFAIRGDVRGLSLWRDNGSAPAAFYAGVDGGPVPEHSLGLQGTLGAALWF